MRRETKAAIHAHFAWLEERGIPIPSVTDFTGAAVLALIASQRKRFKGSRRKRP